MSNRNPDSVQIGHWYAVCCILDLFQIEDKETLLYVRHYLQEAVDDPKEDIGMTTWETLEDAVRELQESGDNIDDRPDLKIKLPEGRR